MVFIESVLIAIWVPIEYLCFFPEGKPIPTELRNEEAALRQEIDLEDEQTAGMHLLFWFFFGLTLFASWEKSERKFGGRRFKVFRRLSVIRGSAHYLSVGSVCNFNTQLESQCKLIENWEF